MVGASAIFLHTINKIVVDADRAVLEINILPPQT